MENESNVRQQLADAAARAERLTSALKRVEGERDRLILELLDREGLHDRQRNGLR